MGKSRKNQPDDGTDGRPVDIPGPHRLPQGKRIQVALNARPLWLGGALQTIVLIKDPDSDVWAIYPDGGDPRAALLVSDAEMWTLACRVIRAVMDRYPGGTP